MLKVMIAEDDLLMADMLEDVLVDSGYEVCGIARSVEEGIRLGERCKPDLAVLDVRLAEGGLGTDIATQLNRQGRPGILYATGNLGQISMANACGEACLGKPFRPGDIVRALEIVRQIVTTGEASRPFPNGFSVIERSSTSNTVSNSKYAEPGEEIRWLHRQQGALSRFGSFAQGKRELGRVLTEAVRVCADGLEVRFCAISRYRAEHNDLLVVAGTGWRRSVVKRVAFRADESSPQGRAFVTGEPVICGDLHNDATFVLPALYAEYGIVSTLDVMIKSEGPHYGVIGLDSPVKHGFNPYDVDFVKGIANVVAESIDSSRRNMGYGALPIVNEWRWQER